MTKTIVGAFFVAVLCVAVALGAAILAGANHAQARRTQVALRELDARTAEAEAARVEAENADDVIRADTDGQAILEIVKGQVERDEDLTAALILLATEDVRARDGWRVYAQMAGIVLVATTAAFGAALYGPRVADALAGWVTRL